MTTGKPQPIAHENEAKPYADESFLTLSHVTNRIEYEKDLIAIIADDVEISCKLYIPPQLNSAFSPWRHIVNGTIFYEISFSKTEIHSFEFNNCTFERCLFIGTIFKDCRFASCRFIQCNPFRVQFVGCFADPSQFDQCLPEHGSANLGVHLFQQLLLNSRQQAQPDFSDEAQFRFRRWQHRQLRAELKANSTRKSWDRVLKYLLALFFDIAAGSGMRLGRLLLSSGIFLSIISLVNWLLAPFLGLKENGQVIENLPDAFYFTTVIMTTLGFGDMTPHTQFGRLVVSCEAICGFVLFAFLTSTLYRRLSS